MEKTSLVSREARVFVSKTARSIAEIQGSVNNMADLVVFLEVLGYNDAYVQKYGFRNLVDLASYVYDFVDAFEQPEPFGSRYEARITSGAKRLGDSLSMVFPWVGSLVLLFTAGVSLWMAWGLPSAVTTAFLSGVFLGLVVSEGLVQTMNRLFSFYNTQTNIGEVRRSISRHYALAAVLIAIASAGIFGFTLAARIPLELAIVAIGSFATIAIHRLSFVILYALKKRLQIIAAYGFAFAVLLSVSFSLTPSISDPTLRYFGALGSAFGVLTAFAIYYHFRLMSNSAGVLIRNAPHFYTPVSINDNTIKSKFSIQLWECLPYAIYGIAYFIILFGDRVVSWFFNPVHASAVNGVVLPLTFNPAYHAGADLALFVLIPSAILQYVLAEPVYLLANNKAIIQKVRDHPKMDSFLRYSYRRIILWTLIAAVLSAAVVNIFAPIVVAKVGGTAISLRILQLASIGAILLSIYAANGIYLVLLGRVVALAKVSIVAAGLVIAVGVFMASLFGFSSAIWGYLAGTAFAVGASSMLMINTLKNASERLFARFI